MLIEGSITYVDTLQLWKNFIEEEKNLKNAVKVIILFFC